MPETNFLVDLLLTLMGRERENNKIVTKSMVKIKDPVNRSGFKTSFWSTNSVQNTCDNRKPVFMVTCVSKYNRVSEVKNRSSEPHQNSPPSSLNIPHALNNQCKHLKL